MGLTRACDCVAAWRPSLMASEARTPSLMLAPTLARDGPMQLYAVVNASCMPPSKVQPIYYHRKVPGACCSMTSSKLIDMQRTAVPRRPVLGFTYPQAGQDGTGSRCKCDLPAPHA